MTSLLWTLIAIQIAMGAFDTLYHHELTERLAWRPSQRTNCSCTASATCSMRCCSCRSAGWRCMASWRSLIMAMLVTEVVITLMDFVEEDLSRSCRRASGSTTRCSRSTTAPSWCCCCRSCRLGESDRPKPRVLRHWSILAALAAIGVVIFGLRDFAARAAGAQLRPAAAVARLRPRQTILITGATGFIGTRLVAGLPAPGIR